MTFSLRQTHPEIYFWEIKQTFCDDPQNSACTLLNVMYNPSLSLPAHLDLLLMIIFLSDIEIIYLNVVIVASQIFPLS